MDLCKFTLLQLDDPDAWEVKARPLDSLDVFELEQNVVKKLI